MLSRSLPPKTAMSDPSRPYSTLAATTIAPKATAISTCHPHQLAPNATAIIASANTTTPTRTRNPRGCGAVSGGGLAGHQAGGDVHGGPRAPARTGRAEVEVRFREQPGIP